MSFKGRINCSTKILIFTCSKLFLLYFGQPYGFLPNNFAFICPFVYILHKDKTIKGRLRNAYLLFLLRFWRSKKLSVTAGAV